MLFFGNIFAYIKKKSYLCTRFRMKRLFSGRILELFALFCESCMVVLAQLAEHRIVVPSVVGSSPTFHPNIEKSASYAENIEKSVKKRSNEYIRTLIRFFCVISIVIPFVRISFPHPDYHTACVYRWEVQ